MRATRSNRDSPESDSPDVADLRARLGRLLGYETPPPVAGESDGPLPRRWLVCALRRARHLRGLTGPVATGSLSDRRLREATLHWVGADVEAVLAADDPRTEVAAVYRGLARLERRGAATRRGRDANVAPGHGGAPS